MENRNRIRALEEENAELAKEILLNESALFEVKKEISEIDVDLIEHPSIKDRIRQLEKLISIITKKNLSYKEIIYSNNVEIDKLENDG